LLYKNVPETKTLLKKPKNYNRLYKGEILYFVPETCTFLLWHHFFKKSRLEQWRMFKEFKILKARRKWL